MATIPPPPPPPPVGSIGRSTIQPRQPDLHGASTHLARSAGTPAYSHHVGSVRGPTSTEHRRPLADLDSAQLQHAAKCLRKTEHGQSLYAPEPASSMGRPAEFPVRGHWPSDEKHARLAEHTSGAPLHASNAGPYASASVGFMHGHSVPIVQQQFKPQNYSYNSYTTTNYDSIPPPLPLQPPPSGFNAPPNNVYSSQTTYSYVYPPDYVARSSQQTQLTEPAGIQTYKSYTSSSVITTTAASNTNTTITTTTTITNIPSTTITYGPNQSIGRPNSDQLPSGYIINPQTYIHDFATRTPIADLSLNGPPVTHNTRTTNLYSYSSTNTNNVMDNTKQPYGSNFEMSNYSTRPTEPYRQPTQPSRPNASNIRFTPQSSHNLYEERIRSNQRVDQIDSLVYDMEMRLRTGQDVCAKCAAPIVSDQPGVTAVGKSYHVNCFSCHVCAKQLAGCSFYNVDGKNLCQVDYMSSLEKCDKCATPITQKILRALGKAYHPNCFTCPSCQKSLDGNPFSVGKENVAYCLDCFHEKFSPRCAVCLKAIAPSASETEVARVVAMDKSFHVDCYRCEDCGMQLNSKIEGAACYPLESHLFCRNCNLNRLKAAS